MGVTELTARSGPAAGDPERGALARGRPHLTVPLCAATSAATMARPRPAPLCGTDAGSTPRGAGAEPRVRALSTR